jgi:hypothetical protein
MTAASTAMRIGTTSETLKLCHQKEADVKGKETGHASDVRYGDNTVLRDSQESLLLVRRETSHRKYSSKYGMRLPTANCPMARALSRLSICD